MRIGSMRTWDVIAKWLKDINVGNILMLRQRIPKAENCKIGKKGPPDKSGGLKTTGLMVSVDVRLHYRTSIDRFFMRPP
jgi:hypothetical protein